MSCPTSPNQSSTISLSLTPAATPEAEAVRQTLVALEEIERTLPPVLELARKHRKYLEEKRSGKIAAQVGGQQTILDIDSDATYTPAEINSIQATLTLALPTLFYIHLRLKGIKLSCIHPVRKLMATAGEKIRVYRSELNELVEASDGIGGLVESMAVSSTEIKVKVHKKSCKDGKRKSGKDVGKKKSKKFRKC